MRSEKISAFLASRIEARDFPSAVYLAAERGEIVFHEALGLAVVEPEKIEARTDTIYDLASLTKPLVTGLLCACLIERGKIDPKTRAAEFFEGFETSEKREITIGNLLTHTSGLPAWKPFYLPANKIPDPDYLFESGKILEVISGESLESAPGTRVVYSDLNFILLGFLIERVFGERLETVAEREIFAPLKLTNTFYNPPRALLDRIAASETGNAFERQTCLDTGFDVSAHGWRDYQIRGEVHDGNCYFMKGVSGHAGLFSTAGETFKMAQQFLAEETVLLKPETCRLFRTNFTPGLNEARSVAFQLAETNDSTAGAALSGDSFGHLGFTGTSLWVEPETERIFILLTNRTHARRLPFVNINSVRRRFHELASAELNDRK